MKITSDSAIRITFETPREAKVFRRLLLFVEPMVEDHEGQGLLMAMLNGLNQHLYPVEVPR